MAPQVKDVMGRRAVALAEATPVARVAWALRVYAEAALPVVDGEGRVVGIVSEDDVLVREWARAPLPAKASGTTAAQIMTRPALTVQMDTTVREAAKLMHEHGVRVMPVVESASGRMLGLLRRSDLLRLVTEQGGEAVSAA
ncbi:CBS domain-containing protein [Nonomuraea pusilla]|uniref:CBS domain-containing protein n=1 Tax=Nonomuraea pusilla TaxID=46177 RepID=UPI003320A4A3